VQHEARIDNATRRAKCVNIECLVLGCAFPHCNGRLQHHMHTGDTSSALLPQPIINDPYDHRSVTIPTSRARACMRVRVCNSPACFTRRNNARCERSRIITAIDPRKNQRLTDRQNASDVAQYEPKILPTATFVMESEKKPTLNRN
jgi:hypothetical protein